MIVSRTVGARRDDPAGAPAGRSTAMSSGTPHERLHLDGRSARRGSHQFHLPMMAMNDGTRSTRTIVASISTASASPSPNCCRPGTLPATKPREGRGHHERRRGDQAAVRSSRPPPPRRCRRPRPRPRASARRGTPRSPSRGRRGRRRGRSGSSLRSRERWTPRGRRRRRSGRRDEQAVARGDGEQVQDDRLERQEQRAEREGEHGYVSSSAARTSGGSAPYARARKSTPCGAAPPTATCVWAGKRAAGTWRSRRRVTSRRDGWSPNSWRPTTSTRGRSARRARRRGRDPSATTNASASTNRSKNLT